MKNRTKMIRLLVQFIGENPFGEPLHELGIFEDENIAIDTGLELIDETVKSMFINRGTEWVRIR